MYTVENYRTKKALRQAVAAGEEVRLFAPGLGEPRTDGMETVEGPHFPAAHSWYARVQMRDGLVVKVIA